MPIHNIDKGATSQIIPVKLRSSTTGQLVSGKVFGDMTASYQRNTAATKVDMTLQTMTAGTWASLGFIETQQTGVYQLGLPDAALLTGADVVTVKLTCTGILDAVETIVLRDYTAARAAKLDYLDVAVSTRITAGGGAITDTFTIYQTDGTTPLAGADVWVSTDEAGANVIAGPIVSNSSGLVTFSLDIVAGLYVHVQIGGYNFSGYPKQFNVVAGGFEWA